MAGTEFDEILKHCVVQGLSVGMETSVNSECIAIEGGTDCYCDAYGYGTRGPHLFPIPPARNMCLASKMLTDLTKRPSCSANLDMLTTL